MASPVIDIRDTGRNSARTGDVRGLSDNVVHSWTSATTGTIAVTASANYDVSFTQPADTIIRNIIAIPAGNIVTAGASGDDLDFSMGTASGGAQLMAAKAIFIASTLYSSSARSIYARLKPLANDLATAATTVTYLVEFLHLGVLPD